MLKTIDIKNQPKLAFAMTLLITVIMASLCCSEAAAQRGGGDRGGGRGGRGGGGFDPSSFLKRLDSNGNGSIDPDEQQGPAKFFLERMARENKKIDLSKPIKLEIIGEELAKMRGQSGRGGNDRGRGGDDDDSDEDPANTELVMGFGMEEPLSPVLGFGADAEVFSVRVLEEDTREAEERMRRYDRNRDGSLDQRELQRGRFSGNPLQYDRNGNGSLSISELSVRYARRRLEKESSDDDDRRGRDRGDRRGYGSRDEQDEKEEEGLWKDRASYRLAPSRGPGAEVQGLPSWFTRDDRDENGELSMNEFASKWSDALIEEFFQFDPNRDGVITTSEALAAVKNGVTRGGSSSGSQSSSRSSSSSRPSQDSEAADSGGDFSLEGLPEDADDRWVKYSVKKLSVMDQNGNKKISVDEWSTSLGAFDKVDTNSDGNISVAEYLIHRKSR